MQEILELWHRSNMVSKSRISNKIFYFFFGTTAELIRIASIVKELKKRNVSYKLIDSGQTNVRYEEVKEYLGRIKPDIAFKQKASSYGLRFFSIWAIRTFFSSFFIFGKEFLKYDRKDIILVIYGDPVTTSIGAIVAKFFNVKIAHIESGDLTFNLLEPFPEEICRNINIRLADILFPPGKWALHNLKNIEKPKINTVYNTLADSFWWFMNRRSKIKQTVSINNVKYYILIMHRQEHVFFGKEWTKDTLKYVIENSDPKLSCVLFNHPLTVRIIKCLDLPPDRKIIIIPPVSYREFLQLLKNSEYIATDGATNQYEAYLLGKPCVILRNHTEQIEGLRKNVLLYQSEKTKLNFFLKNYKKFRKERVTPNISTAKIIVNSLISLN